MKITSIVLLLIAVFVVAPIALIWALNTLFPTLGIPFTFHTWLAASILSAPFTSTSRSK